jgi:hypothetical protein
MLAGRDRGLDGGLGGYSSFYISESGVGVGGSGYFQVTDDKNLVNVSSENLTWRSKWGGYGYFDFFLNIGSSDQTLQFVVGGGAMNIQRGRVDGKTIVENPVGSRGELVASNMTKPGVILLLKYNSKLVPESRRTNEVRYRVFESTIGLAGSGIYAAMTLYVAPWLGFNLQGMFYTKSDGWHEDNLISFSPVLRFNFN